MKGGTKETLVSAVLRETRNFSDFSTSRSSMMEMLKHCDVMVESKVKLKVTGTKSSLAAVNQVERESRLDYLHFVEQTLNCFLYAGVQF